MRGKGWKENLRLQAVMMIYPVTPWSEITQYNNKRAILIANLVDTTWLYLCPRPMELTYDQKPEFIIHGFKKS